jgi:hypothetical protein
MKYPSPLMGEGRVRVEAKLLSPAASFSQGENLNNTKGLLK